MSDLSTAKEIQNQLGGKCLYMLGAKNLAGDNKSLSFRIRGSKKVNHIKIALNSSDLYDVTFSKIHGASCRTIVESNSIYADMLHTTIEENTGLYTKLF